LPQRGPGGPRWDPPVRALLVVELLITHQNDIAESLEALRPPTIPHFAGKLRVTLDAFGGDYLDNPATAIVNYLDGEGAAPP
jgi:hypothetical protein